LDLRDDPGGVLLGAVGVSSAFLPSDSLIVYTDGRANNAKAKFYAKPQDYVFRYTQASQDPIQNIPSEVKTVPLTVLVNAGSASASEIVAGALQDHKRAVLVGTQTFGKGLVQSVIPLANGAGMKLTTAHYYTPKGRSIQIKGITPDVIVEAGTLNTINELKRTREADLVGHLGNPQEPSNDSQETSRKKGNVNSTGTSSENQEGQSETKNLAKAVKDPNITDNQLNQALNILKAQQVLSQR
jgi:carboxyl-terminal processing protease